MYIYVLACSIYEKSPLASLNVNSYVLISRRIAEEYTVVLLYKCSKGKKTFIFTPVFINHAFVHKGTKRKKSSSEVRTRDSQRSVRYAMEKRGTLFHAQ